MAEPGFDKVWRPTSEDTEPKNRTVLEFQRIAITNGIGYSYSLTRQISNEAHLNNTVGINVILKQKNTSLQYVLFLLSLNSI